MTIKMKAIENLELLSFGTVDYVRQGCLNFKVRGRNPSV